MKEKTKSFKRAICVFFTFILIIAMTSCGSSSKNFSNNKSDLSVSEDKKEEISSGNLGGTDSGSVGTGVENNQKIIKRASATIETLNFDESIEKINTEITKFNGYIESSSMHDSSIRQDYRSRTSDITIRIPSNNFDVFINGLGNIGHVPYQDITTENITSQYVDAEARVKTLKVQEERLLEILKQGKELKDILEIETQLSNVRYQIESYTGNLKQWDNLIDYSTITLHVQEVDEILIEAAKPKSLIDKISVRFRNSVENIVKISKTLVVFTVSCIPYIIILIPIIIIIRLILKKKEVFKNKK